MWRYAHTEKGHIAILEAKKRYREKHGDRIREADRIRKQIKRSKTVVA